VTCRTAVARGPAADRRYSFSMALEKPVSSNSFSENATLPSGATSTLQGTQPFDSVRNRVLPPFVDTMPTLCRQAPPHAIYRHSAPITLPAISHPQR